MISSTKASLVLSSLVSLIVASALPVFDTDASALETSLTQCCNIGGAPNLPGVQAGINWLNKVPGSLWTPANTCTKLWCQNNSGIYLCSTIGSFVSATGPHLGGFAQTVYNQCQTGGKICGSQVDSLGYSLVIDSC